MQASKPVRCVKCRSGMHRVSSRRASELWRCQQCGAEQTVARKPVAPDPRVAKPQ